MRDYSVNETKKQEQKANRVSAGVLGKLSNFLELPQEVLLGISKIVLIGNNRLLVENCKGIVEFENQKIRLSTVNGLVKIQGENLIIKEITSESVIIIGEISSLKFLE